ncbi:MAG: hypothetical protein LBE64_08440 [Acinetobacter pittii]|nr:hypothetical protein [Acinetobacter pittii]
MTGSQGDDTGVIEWVDGSWKFYLREREREREIGRERKRKRRREEGRRKENRKGREKENRPKGQSESPFLFFVFCLKNKWKTWHLLFYYFSFYFYC